MERLWIYEARLRVGRLRMEYLQVSSNIIISAQVNAQKTCPTASYLKFPNPFIDRKVAVVKLVC